MGLNNVVNAGYLGFGLHLVIGTLIGTVLWGNGIRWRKIRLLIPVKSSLLGIAAGIIVWLILFLPITALLIQPSIQRIVVILAIAWQKTVLANQLSHSINKHCAYGNSIPPCMGRNIWLCNQTLLRIRVYKIRQHYKDIMNIDPRIRLVTICDANGSIIFYGHREGVQNLLSKEESKKSLEMAMGCLESTGWIFRQNR